MPWIDEEIFSGYNLWGKLEVEFEDSAVLRPPIEVNRGSDLSFREPLRANLRDIDLERCPNCAGERIIEAVSV